MSVEVYNGELYKSAVACSTPMLNFYVPHGDDGLCGNLRLYTL